MDTAKAVGEISALYVGVRGMIRIFRMLRAAFRKSGNPGVTIHNGEYVALVQSIGRINERLDDQHGETATALRGIHEQMASMELRLSKLKDTGSV